MQVLANGLRLEYDTFGERSAKAILLISGLNTPMTRWTDAFCTRLADHDHYVIRFDNRDCGLSQHFDQCQLPNGLKLIIAQLLGLKIPLPYTMYDMVNDAVGLLDVLEIQQAHVIGRSMGGMIAQLMAVQYPERVERLSLIMTSSGNRMRSFPELKVLQFLMARKPNPRNNLAGFLKYRVGYTKAIGSKKYPLDDFFIRSRVMADIRRSGFHPGSARRQFAALLAAGDITRFSQRISVPTTIIHGDADPLVPLRSGLYVHKHIKNAHLTVIENMGHALQPQFYGQIVSALLG